MSQKTERRAIDKTFVFLGSVATVVLLVVAALSWYGYSFASGMVTSELSAQKIYFPEKNSEAFQKLSADDQKEIEPYAGQQLTNGLQAKAYANHYIGAHLKNIGNGLTYAEISEEAMKDPTNEKLQMQKTMLFQGETLRGMLLGTGYAFWTFSMIALAISVASIVGALFMSLLVYLGLRHLAKLR